MVASVLNFWLFLTPPILYNCYISSQLIFSTLREWDHTDWDHTDSHVYKMTNVIILDSDCCWILFKYKTFLIAIVESNLFFFSPRPSRPMRLRCLQTEWKYKMRDQHRISKTRHLLVSRFAFHLFCILLFILLCIMFVYISSQSSSEFWIGVKWCKINTRDGPFVKVCTVLYVYLHLHFLMLPRFSRAFHYFNHFTWLKNLEVYTVSYNFIQY